MPVEGVDGVDAVVLSLEPQRRAGHAGAERRGGEPLVAVVGVQRDWACGLSCGLVDREGREEGPEDVAVGDVEGDGLVELRDREGRAVDDDDRHAYADAARSRREERVSEVGTVGSG